MKPLDDGVSEFDREPAGGAEPGFVRADEQGAARAPRHADRPAGRAATGAARSPRVSIDDVLTRSVQVVWVEAVAIVEELCAVLTLEQRAAPAVPEPSDIFLTSYGTIELSRKRSQEGSLAGLGRVLHALLSTGPVPVGLRLFVAKATAPDAFDSVGTFASDLAYFAPPGDRAALIRAVYERCRQASVPSQTASQADDRREETREPAPERSRRIPPRAVAAAALLAASAAGAVMVYQAGGISLPSFSAASLVPASLSSPSGAPKEAGNATSPQRASTRPRASKAPAPEPADRPAGSSQPASTTTARNTDGPGTLIDLRALLAAMPAAPAKVPLDHEADSSRVIAPAEEVNVYATTEPPAVYASADADVEPPVMLFPHLPQTDLVPEAHAPASALELVIDEEGSVEQAKLLTRPTRMPDMMILSGAKMWRFQPASRAGVPVKYRMVLRWSVAP